jgi:CO/xanthine dehydrogenase Mo-binding subunit
MGNTRFPSQSIHRIDAVGKVTGATLYPGDITPPNLLHGKVLFSQQPHARWWPSTPAGPKRCRVWWPS